MVGSNHQGPSPLAWASGSACRDIRSKARSIDEYAEFAPESIPLAAVSVTKLGAVAVAWREGLIIDDGSSQMLPTLDIPSRLKALAKLRSPQGDRGRSESAIPGPQSASAPYTTMGLPHREFPRNISTERTSSQYA